MEVVEGGGIEQRVTENPALRSMDYSKMVRFSYYDFNLFKINSFTPNNNIRLKKNMGDL